VVIEAEDGRVVAEVGEGIGIATNNVAEYKAASRGLALARDLGAKRILLRSDSRLLIEQLAGRWKVKHPGLIPLNAEARRLLSGFRDARLRHVPRERNREADRQANIGVDLWLVEQRGRPRGPGERGPGTRPAGPGDGRPQGARLFD